MAIICHSRASEKYVFESLATFKFNLREISDLPGSDNLFGVIVKIRKNAKTPQQVNTRQHNRSIILNLVFFLVYTY